MHQDILNTPLSLLHFLPQPRKLALQLGTWGCELHQDLEYQEDDPIVAKHRTSPFYATALEAHLRARGIDTVIIIGVSTNNAVQACARDTHDRDYKMVILEDTCGRTRLKQ